MSDCVSLETIAAIISNAYRSFAWGKRASTWKTMLGYISDIALEEFQLSLADLEASSRKLASEMTREEYDAAVENYKWQDDRNLRKEYNSIPYIFTVGDDGIITVVFNSNNRPPSCTIQELTTEMMEMIKYMGLVRMYILEETNFTIPYLPDNIIHLEIDDYNVLETIDANRNISFPRFLRGFIDKIGQQRQIIDVSANFTYTNRLPSNLLRLETSCKHYTNLPASLLEYRYINNSYEGTFDFPNFECFPIGIESIKVLNVDNRFNSRIIVKLNNEIIKPITKMQYLEFPIGHILSDNLVFGNIQTLYISWFYNWVTKCTIINGEYTGNLKFKCNFPCHCGWCEAYEHTTKVILEDGIEHLILDYNDSQCFVDIIEYASSSLKLLTIKNVSKKLLRVCNAAGFELETSKLPDIPQSVFDENHIKFEFYYCILNFQRKYPQVSVVFT